MAKLFIEVELEITGTRQKAEPDVGISQDWWEDIDIESATLVRTEYTFKDGVGSKQDVRADLFDGLCDSAKNTLLRNIISWWDEDKAQEALDGDL